MKVVIRAVVPTDQDWLSEVFTNQGLGQDSSVEVNMLNLSALPGYVAQIGADRVGVISYQVAKKHYEIIMLHSDRPGLGIGRALVNSVIMEANDAKFKKVITVTKNGNEKAVSFYKGLGFAIASVRPAKSGGTARHVEGKPVEPTRASGHDEIELVFKL